MLQTASFTGFLRTVLIIVLIYYGVKILMRLSAPYMAKFLSKKMQERYGEQFGQQQSPNRSSGKEGETVIDTMPKQTPTSNKKVGEYIDYEEID